MVISFKGEDTCPAESVRLTEPATTGQERSIPSCCPITDWPLVYDLFEGINYGDQLHLALDPASLHGLSLTKGKRWKN